MARNLPCRLGLRRAYRGYPDLPGFPTDYQYFVLVPQDVPDYSLRRLTVPDDHREFGGARLTIPE